MECLGTVEYVFRNTFDSPLHLALSNPDCQLKDIQKLLDQGANINEVDRMGNPPLLRALRDPQFKLDVIKLLLDKGAKVKVKSVFGKLKLKIHTESILPVYECKDHVMRVLLDHATEVNFTGERTFHALHYAISNHMCKVDDLKKLINRGENVNAKDGFGESPLHLHLGMSPKVDIKLIQCLIDHGADVNLIQGAGYTPLKSAVFNRHCDLDILKLLLDNGALTNVQETLDRTPLYFAILDNNASEIHNFPCENTLGRVKLLIKYAMIETLDFDIEAFFQASPMQVKNHHELADFARDCALEMQKMDSEIMYETVTLRDFVSGQTSGSVDGERMNQVLIALADNDYPLYKEVILVKLKRSALLNKLAEQVMYTKTTNHSTGERIVVLDSYSSCSVAKYLSVEDLLNLVLAFKFTGGRVVDPSDFLGNDHTTDLQKS